MLVVTELRGKSQKIEIRGHAARTSQSEKQPEKDPWQISYDRCQAVMKFLVQQGIDAERLRLSQGGPYEPYSLDSNPSLQLPQLPRGNLYIGRIRRELHGLARRTREPIRHSLNNNVAATSLDIVMLAGTLRVPF